MGFLIITHVVQKYLIRRNIIFIQWFKTKKKCLLTIMNSNFTPSFCPFLSVNVRPDFQSNLNSTVFIKHFCALWKPFLCTCGSFVFWWHVKLYFDARTFCFKHVHVCVVSSCTCPPSSFMRGCSSLKRSYPWWKNVRWAYMKDNICGEKRKVSIQIADEAAADFNRGVTKHTYWF